MSKGLWRILLIVTGILTCWYGSTASISLWQHLKLDLEIPAQVVNWEIISKRSQYALKATYQYSHAGKNFTGTELLPKPYYLNRDSAEREIRIMEKIPWTVWIDARHPEHSSIENRFPFRKVAYAVCLIGILFYFAYLKFHLELLSSKM